MTPRTLTVRVGASLLLDGDAVRVVEFDGRSVVVHVLADGSYRSVALAEFAVRARALGEAESDDGDPALVLAGLSAPSASRWRPARGMSGRC
ncbi:hypothetical protein [Streptomyces sp. x-80]|uniref:hypothetical protein n=1 Tax=Streptomyces sp. x-80 TaxID=2789282 RepID=UPI0039814FC7